MTDIGPLLCGSGDTEGAAKQALDQLSKSIEFFSTKAIAFLKEPISPDALSFGPFCARVLLENGCAALVGRLDMFRVLYLSEFQNQPAYVYGKRVKSAFSWAGDVIPDEKCGTEMWNADHDLQKINRALFSKYMDHIYWKPAVERMWDYVASYPTNPALDDILKLEIEKYIDVTRGKSLQLYSSLSKGVHWEFFSSALMFDEDTLKALIRDTLLLVGHLGLTSHFIPTAYASLSPDEAVGKYISFREDVS